MKVLKVSKQRVKLNHCKVIQDYQINLNITWSIESAIGNGNCPDVRISGYQSKKKKVVFFQINIVHSAK